MILVGELNPYAVDPRYALFDLPVHAAGWRLRTTILQVDRRTYFSFDRVNLCTGRWSVQTARLEAARIAAMDHDVIVMLGRKVASAFAKQDMPAFTREGRFIALPHPSGRCREWNVPGAILRAQEILREALPQVAWGSQCP